MSEGTLLKEAKDLVAGCDRCGTCLTVCPLFKVRDVERSSARGKNAIARALAEGGLDVDEVQRGRQVGHHETQAGHDEGAVAAFVEENPEHGDENQETGGDRAQARDGEKEGGKRFAG